MAVMVAVVAWREGRRRRRRQWNCVIIRLDA